MVSHSWDSYCHWAIRPGMRVSFPLPAEKQKIGPFCAGRRDLSVCGCKRRIIAAFSRSPVHLSNGSAPPGTHRKLVDFLEVVPSANMSTVLFYLHYTYIVSVCTLYTAPLQLKLSCMACSSSSVSLHCDWPFQHVIIQSRPS